MLRRTLLLALLVAVGRVAGAQPAVGSEFRVNTYTTAHQYLPAVAADADGNFVVVWSSYPQPDGTKTGVFGQRFDHRGNMRGSEFAVSTFTNGYQYDIFNSVAMHPSGSFVVTWTDGYGQDGSYYGIFGQRYDASGNPAGPQFQVNASATDYQIQSDVAYSATGNFVVVWASFGQDGSYYGVFGRRFDGAGNPLGSEFQVNTYTPGSQWWPAVAAGPTGEFVVVWQSYGRDGQHYGVFGRRYDAAGNALGAEFQVNTYTISAQDYPDVAIDAAGNFVVAWDSFAQDGAAWGIFAQRFDAAGSALGPEFRVNTFTSGDQWISSVTRDPDGDFVVAWTSTYQVSGADIFAQRFNAAGAPLGTEFQVNTYTANSQFRPAVASLGDEKFVVTWSSDAGQDGDGAGVFAQLYGDLIFKDGFDAGP